MVQPLTKLICIASTEVMTRILTIIGLPFPTRAWAVNDFCIEKITLEMSCLQ